MYSFRETIDSSGDNVDCRLRMDLKRILFCKAPDPEMDVPPSDWMGYPPHQAGWSTPSWETEQVIGDLCFARVILKLLQH